MGRRQDWNIDSAIAQRLRAFRRDRAAPRVTEASCALLCGLDLPAHVDSLAPLAAFVAEAVRRRGLGPDDTRMVELAVYEACLNVIEHAYGFDDSRRFRVDFLQEDDRMTFQIADGGRSLDAARLERSRKDDGSDTARRTGRGLGLRIITRAMDHVHCEKTDDGENRLVLVKQLHPVAVSNEEQSNGII